jgi:3-isopropylmalate dehydrogenase
MAKRSDLHIAVFPGDGIGPEVMNSCLKVLEQFSKGAISLSYEWLEAGAEHYRQTGTALPDSAIARAEKADAILFGAMGIPWIRYEDGREIAPQLDLREHFQLYAGVRPVRTVPGLPSVLSDARGEQIDFVLVRESTEGLFAHRRASRMIDGQRATDILEISRPASERVFDFSFRLAAARRKRNGIPMVTCIDKANVLASFGFFRKIFDEISARYPDVNASHMYVDAAALNLVRQPWAFDVMVTENMFGDILSDLGAALLGGIGMAPSADIGDTHALFQPCHGTAPDIAGVGSANPIGMILSAAMMLEWMAVRYSERACLLVADRIRAAIDHAFATGMRPIELGGSDDTNSVTAKVIAARE